MNNKLLEICNNNSLNCPSDDNYFKFNDFIFSNDLKLFGKCLHRFEHFLNVKKLPGDIVEIGVFKGSGIATFSKFIDVYCPNSNKKIIGFDIFDSIDKNEILDKDGEFDKDKMNLVYSKVNQNELSIDNVEKNLSELPNKRHILVKGDVEESIPNFLKNNPGLRISMLYIDVDLERPTYMALKYLWDRILPGGVILFDEYEYHKFSESNGADKFFKEFQLKYPLISTDWIAPTCYFYKEI